MTNISDIDTSCVTDCDTTGVTDTAEGNLIINTRFLNSRIT